MKTFWLIIAALCGLVAAVLLIEKDFDKAFIVAAIGAVGWFLSYRVQMKELIEVSNKGDEDEDIVDIDDD